MEHNFERWRVIDLKAEAKLRGLRGYSRLRKSELIDHLKQSERPIEQSVGSFLDSRKVLLKLCKERKIKYAETMNKKEMIEVLRWNDEDKSITYHSDTQRKVLDYRNNYNDNPEQREKARECSRRWRINNPKQEKQARKKAIKCPKGWILSTEKVKEQ